MNSFRSGLILATLFVGVTACDGGDGKDPTDETGDTDTDGCTTTISSTLPADAATEVYYRTPIEVNFSADAPDATLTLTDAGGTEVTGTSSADGKKAIFAPGAALMPSTAYTLGITYCDGEKSAETTFTTSATGAAIADPATLVGNTYDIDLATARITEPPGVGGLLTGLLADLDEKLLVSVGEYDMGASTLTMFGALGSEDGGTITQDTCEVSIEFPIAADFSGNPYFEIEGDDVTIGAAGIEVTLKTLKLTGSFAPDGASLDGVTLEGSADTRDFVELLGDALGGATGDTAVCDLVGQLAPGVECEDCGDGSITCLSIVADSLEANQVAGLSLVQVTQDDICADGTCETDPGECDGGTGGTDVP